MQMYLTQRGKRVLSESEVGKRASLIKRESYSRAGRREVNKEKAERKAKKKKADGADTSDLQSDEYHVGVELERVIPIGPQK